MGKTSGHQKERPSTRKHPHARGEDTTGLTRLAGRIETPPRTWGRPYTQPAGRLKAGKHPHARGEDLEMIARVYAEMETPPRTWGRQLHAFANKTRLRNTPTHVGKTLINISPPGAAWKHPHARGEDRSVPDSSVSGAETPPRTWGRHALKDESGADERNTPTHVGKTHSAPSARQGR